MWSKWLESESGYRALKKLRLALEEQGLKDWITEINIENDAYYLTSGSFTIRVFDCGDEKYELVNVVNTKIPQEIIPHIEQRISNSSFWARRVCMFIQNYGLNSQPWQKRSEDALLDILQKSIEADYTDANHLFVLDAIQQIMTRCSPEVVKRITDYLAYSPFKCDITGIWFPGMSKARYSYFAEAARTRTINVFNKLPFSYWGESRFVAYQGSFFDRGMPFVLVSSNKEETKRLKSGKNISKYPGYLAVPEFLFDERWARVACGHYDESGHVIDGLCQECVKTISPTGKIINSYSTKAPEFLKFQVGNYKKGKFTSEIVYFGAELELEDGGQKEAISLYRELKDFLLVKSDGSIRNGFEIITTPATYEVQKKSAEVLFTIINEKTKMKAKSNCGLHFHVSKNALSTLQIGKLLEFLHNPNNKDFIEGIAGRKANSYCQVRPDRKITDVAPENNFMGERYEALNLTNKETIEFRIFASTTKYEEYMHRLEFVKALIDYTKPCAVNVKSLSELKEQSLFTNFLSNSKKEYPFLCTFLGLKKPFLKPESV